MGVVKTASESILEETVVPSEEANYSLQGHAGKSEKGRENVEECVRMRVQLISAVTLRWQLTGGRKIVKEIIAAASQWDQVQRSSFKGDVTSWPPVRERLLTGVWRYRYTGRDTGLRVRHRGQEIRAPFLVTPTSGTSGWKIDRLVLAIRGPRDVEGCSNDVT
ncbi:hypothetical protein HN011_001783 [Eciton burchellii]|nr:hypothetical protein HN011_001783 [Eciton burchellii]